MSSDEGKIEILQEYPTAKSVQVEDFIKDILKQMLNKDQDTLTMMVDVDNSDSSASTIEFDIRLIKLVNKGSK